jgi:hypothetical protein
LKHGAENIEDISGKPDDDELQRESICRSSPEILNYLRRKDNDPACNRY